MGLFGHKASLGFWLSDTQMDAALVRPRKQGWKTAGQHSVKDEALLEQDGRQQRLTQAFLRCTRKLPRVARRADISAVLALPDDHVEEEVLQFAEFPKATKEARALVEHRMARELGRLPDDVAVSWEVFQSDTAAATCRVRAMDKLLRDDILKAAAAAGLRLIRIDGWMGFASGASGLGRVQSGALIWSDGTTWSLLCWAKDDPVGFYQHGQVDALDPTVADMLRLCRSYAMSLQLDGLELVLDMPDSFAKTLSQKAEKIGLTCRKAGAEGGRSRGAQVASWA